VAKLLFLLINFNLSRQLNFSEIAKIFLIGTRMDLSMAAYLTVLPGLILAVSFLFSTKLLNTILRIYSVVILLAITFINLLDLALYPHWGTRIGVNVFSYFADPKEVLANVSFWNGVAAVAVYLFFYILFTWFYKRFILKSISKSKVLKWYFSPVFLFLTALLIIPMRGGFSTSPMNLSTVSFSDKLYVNQASANYLWNFFNTIERRKSYENPCVYMETKRAVQIFNVVENNRTVSDTIIISKPENVQPNVILIVLESFSNKVIPALGGTYNVCPNLDSICNEAVVFPEFYASGNRSDRGISALLGGYPSLLDMSVMRFPDKSDKLTLLSHYFNSHNYNTSFYYGGDIDFYSMKSFVLQGKYSEIVSQTNFPGKLRISKWGVPDGVLFNRVLADVKQKTGPFFTVAYTLSSHPPFDVPFSKIKGNSTDNKFLNSVAYTDSCLGSFIEGLKKLEIWKNTLVIITADHGALYPGSTEIREPATYRIPLIWTGGVVKNPGVVSNICGEPDLMPTLVRQLGWIPDSAKFGHDIFSLPQYAFYMHNTGWGFINNTEKFFYDRATGEIKVFSRAGNKTPDFDFAKAYLQLLHDDFLSK
jgi:phosphoglycerol transferase MdoB-like AlkP superfamily enzyme